MSQMFNHVVYSPDAADEPVGIPGGEVNATISAKLKATDKDKKTRAKRILKSLLPDMIRAAEHEADLAEKSREEARAQIEKIIDEALQPPPDARQSTAPETVHTESDIEGDNSAATQAAQTTADISTEVADVEMTDAEESKDMDSAEAMSEQNPITAKHPHRQNAPASSTIQDTVGSPLGPDNNDTLVSNTIPLLPALSASGSTNPSTTYPGPLTPPDEDKDILPTLAHGGIPWYLEAFEPEGTTIHDERWPGREAMRGISEELSELDDDAVNGLLDNVTVLEAVTTAAVEDTLTVPVVAQKKKAKARKRHRW